MSKIKNKKILLYGVQDNPKDVLWLENEVTSGLNNVVWSNGRNLNRIGFLIAREMGWMNDVVKYMKLYAVPA